MSIDKLYKYLYNKLLSVFILLITLLCGSHKAFAKPVEGVPVVIEIIEPVGKIFSSERFADLKGYTTDGFEIKQWKNRIVVYTHTSNPMELMDRIVKDYPGDKVVLFDKPFYNFYRKYCIDKSEAKHWDNIILTANLVADPKKQAEYLEYHRTQFEKWPEVSQGFCNASFQQVLVFKNGRQLMLIISIPKGESLDKLNPLTTKNNPRVDEWNKIMAKYQEGIEGTKPGETWVFLKPL